ncbi:MAG: Flp family type IVb pilin [Planctomycetota bacterium]
MYTLQQKAWNFLRSEDGPAATEYAVLVAVIAIGVLVAMSGFGTSMNGIYLAISNAVTVVS